MKKIIITSLLLAFLAIAMSQSITTKFEQSGGTVAHCHSSTQFATAD